MVEPTRKISSFTGAKTANQIREAKREAEERSDTPAAEDPKPAVHPEIAKIIPEKISCFFGEVPYQQFKTFYSTVYDQVKSGNHLISGRVLFDTAIGSTKVAIRSLKKKESAFIQAFALSSPNTDFTKTYPLLDIYNLIFGISRVGDVKMPEIISGLDDYKTWSEADNIKSLVEYFQNLDDGFVTVLLNLIADVNMAKRLAFLELVPNP